jgi:hypothetical protein
LNTQAINRRAPVQWFSLQKLAWMLDFDVSAVRAWWRAGEFGPPNGAAAADYFFVRGAGRGADVRISMRGYEYFLQHHTASQAADVIVLARSPGEAQRKVDAAVAQSADLQSAAG